MLPLEHLHQITMLAMTAEFVTLACFAVALPAAGDGVVDTGHFVGLLAALDAPEDVTVCFELAASDNADGLAYCLCHWYTLDRKSTRLNSSHQIISYAVFCLKK